MSAPKPWERISNELLMKPSEGSYHRSTAVELIQQTRGAIQTGQGPGEPTPSTTASMTANSNSGSGSSPGLGICLGLGLGFAPNPTLSPSGPSMPIGGLSSTASGVPGALQMGMEQYPMDNGLYRPMYGGGYSPYGYGRMPMYGGPYGGYGSGLAGSSLQMLDRLSQYIYALCDVAHMLEGNAQGLTAFFALVWGVCRKGLEIGQTVLTLAVQRARRWLAAVKETVVSIVVRYFLETELPPDELARQIYILNKVKLVLIILFCVIVLRYLLSFL